MTPGIPLNPPKFSNFVSGIFYIFVDLLVPSSVDNSHGLKALLFRFMTYKLLTPSSDCTRTAYYVESAEIVSIPQRICLSVLLGFL